MLLVQKQTIIPLASKLRVRKLICLNITTLLIVKAKSMTIYSLQTNKQLFTLNVHDWQKDQFWLQQKIQDQVSIIQAYYHPKLKKILLMLSRKQNIKHQNWLLAETQIVNDSLTTPKILQDYLKCRTKYDHLELKPRVVVFPYSEYYVFLREFYNDSMFVIYKGADNLANEGFFINQENMGCFDQKYVLVSFRAEFKNAIVFELFDIVNSYKDLQSQTYEIKAQTQGVIQAIKRIGYNNKYILTQSNKQQSKEYFECCLALLAVNWHQKQISYLIFNCTSRQVSHNIKIKDSIILMYFINSVDYGNGNCGQKNGNICTLQRKGKQTVLVYEKYWNNHKNICIQNEQQDKMGIETYQIDQIMQQWQVSKQSEKQFVIINYSQPPREQDKLVCKFYRSYNKEEAVLGLCDNLGVDDCLYKHIFQLMGFRNAQ